MKNTISKFTLLLIILSVSNTPTFSATADGMIRIKSNHSVSGTLNKLEAVLKKKGMTIFKRVSHSDGAAKVSMKLRDTELLIFGNPKVGTPLMLCQQTVALDLPQKALAYEDKKGQVWLAYNDPKYIAARHHITGCEKTITKITNALAKLTGAAVK